MPKLTQGVSVLWSGKILGCCKLTLFVNNADPQKVQYELEDKIEYFRRPEIKLWLKNFKPVYEFGELEVLEGTLDEVVPIIISSVKDRYAAITYNLYSEELRNGYLH